MQTTTEKGNLSLLKVMTECASAGYIVSLPIGDGHVYDLILDNGKKLLKCQVKTAHIVNGCINFSVRSNNGMYQKRGTGYRTYKGKIDVFGVYSPDLNSTFLVPIEETGKSSKYLRVQEQKTSRNWRNRERAEWAGKFKVVPVGGARSSEEERSVVARKVEISKLSEHPKLPFAETA